jgi:hypothetical protein
MSYIEHIHHYLSLMRQFLNATLSPRAFDQRYLELWKADRDEEWSIVEGWDRRYDVELHDAFVQGRLSTAEFTSAWNTLFKSHSPKKQAYLHTLNEVFTALDVYEETPQQPWQMDLAALIQAVEQAVKAIEALQISQDDDY